MVDFAELRKRSYEAMDDAGRARVDAYHAAEAAADLTAETIEATFETLERGTSRVLKADTRSIKVRIEQRGEGAEAREIVSFKGAVTGHEDYHLNADFAEFIKSVSDKEDGAFCICAGTPGSYQSCSVLGADIHAYLVKQRPHLFEAPAEGAKP
jgi:hypothetical protein